MDTSSPGNETVPSNEVVPSAKRERRSLEVKRQIVEETLVPGASVARVARAHGVNANQVFYWRHLYRAGRLGNSRGKTTRLLPVSVAETAASGTIVASARSTAAVMSRDRDGGTQPGTIDLELRKARLHITGPCDREALRLVLQALLG